MTDQTWKHEYFDSFGKVFVSTSKAGIHSVKVRTSKGELRFAVSKTGSIRVLSNKKR